MKKSVPNIAVLYSIAIIIASFTICSQVSAQATTVVFPMEENSATCFVRFNDGTIKQYATLKLVTGVLVTPHLLADEKIIIQAKDISAYRNDNHFAVSDKSLISKKMGLVALETLPGFAIRIAKGKMNVYCRKYYNGSNTVDEYFLQHGNDGAIIAYSADVMKNLLKDNAKALEFYNSKEKGTSKSKKLMASANIYNTGELISRN